MPPIALLNDFGLVNLRIASPLSLVQFPTSISHTREMKSLYEFLILYSFYSCKISYWLAQEFDLMQWIQLKNMQF